MAMMKHRHMPANKRSALTPGLLLVVTLVVAQPAAAAPCQATGTTPLLQKFAANACDGFAEWAEAIDIRPGVVRVTLNPETASIVRYARLIQTDSRAATILASIRESAERAFQAMVTELPKVLASIFKNNPKARMHLLAREREWLLTLTPDGRAQMPTI
jgi:hypothetical protein